MNIFEPFKLDVSGKDKQLQKRLHRAAPGNLADVATTAATYLTLGDFSILEVEMGQN